jgi:hypothetical protein
MCSPDGRQLSIKITRNYSCKHEAIGEPNSRDFEVPIPRADLDAVGDGIAVTCSDEEAVKLIDDFAVTAVHIMDMLLVDMSLG